MEAEVKKLYVKSFIVGNSIRVKKKRAKNQLFWIWFQLKHISFRFVWQPIWHMLFIAVAE